MSSIIEGVLRHLQRRIGRGFRSRSCWTTPVEYVLWENDRCVSRDCLEALMPVLRNAAGTVRLGVLCPTFVGRTSAENHSRCIEFVFEQVRDASLAIPDAPLVVFVAMQWQGDEEKAESMRRLQRIVESSKTQFDLSVIGLSLQGPGKIRSINAALQVCKRWNIKGLCWIDDDIRLDRDCLANMFKRFIAKGMRGAVGATKQPHAREQLTSRLLFRAKAIAAPATNYPHGCCIVVETSVLGDGIPDRYASDDGYVCFELIDPTKPNPLENLELVPDAICHYYVAGPAGETSRRIRRLLLNHHIYLADYPLPVAKYYFQHVLFNGLWPLAPWDASRGFRFGLIKGSIKWTYFVLFAAVGIELYLRGLLGRPLGHVRWSGYSQYPVQSPAR
jgi:hypothetical protein